MLTIPIRVPCPAIGPVILPAVSKTYWLSDADAWGFWGVAVIHVSEDETAMAWLNLTTLATGLDAEWVCAETWKTQAFGITPGGTVATCEIVWPISIVC